jgi:soluble lytic murein transglycosylase
VIASFARPFRRLAARRLPAAACLALLALPGPSHGTEASPDASEADPLPALVPLSAPGPWGADGLHPAEPLPEALRPASDAVARGQGPRALGLLDAVDADLLQTPAGRLLRAEALRQSGDCDAAAPAYEAVLLHAPRLADRVRLHLADCLIDLGRPGDAAAVLADVPADSRHHRAARLKRARALLDAAQPAAARQALRGELPADLNALEAAETHLLRGRAAFALGDAESALADLVRTILSAPGHVYAREAAEAVAIILEDDADLAGAWTRLAGALGFRNTSARLARLAGDRRMAPLAAIVAASRAHLEAEAGRHVAALPLFAEAAESADTDVAARSRYGAALSAQALGRLRVARATFEAVAEAHPAHPLAAPARLEAARIALRSRDHEGARDLLQDLLLERPVGPERPQALFLLGWSHLREDAPAAAAGFFASAAAESASIAAFEDVYGGTAIASAARAHYWAGRAHALAGNTAEAEAAWRHVLAHHPLSYYAALAQGHLGAGGSLALQSATPDDADTPLDPRVVRARQALDLGWTRKATQELGPVMLRPAETDGRSILAAARLLEEMGRTAAARGLYRAAVLHGSADLAPAEREAAWRFAFPRRYGELIEREANRWGYSPWLLYGLVLRESGFSPCAQSHAGATGLTQLMMSAAGDAAADLRLDPPTPENLCDPEYNVRLGAWHLRKLLRRYDGSEVLALAAYNAGPGSVDRWLERSGEVPIDVFVEEIPFEETRAYVRLVISAARGYAFTWDTPGSGALGIRVGPPATEDDDGSAGTFTSAGH